MEGYGFDEYGGLGPFGSINYEHSGVSLFRKRPSETQLRIEPTNAVASDPLGDVGRITFIPGADLVTGDRFELRDYVNPTIKFVFDLNGGSVTETSVTRVIVFDGTETAEEIRDLALAAIAAAPLLDMVGTALDTDRIQVDQPAPGPDGKGTIVKSVADPAFLVELSEPDGSHVMCLGSDLLLPPVEDYAIGDVVSCYQTITVPAATKLVKVQARFRQPANLPVREALPVGTEVENVIRAAVANMGVVTTPTAFFTQEQHLLRSVYLTGAGIVDGTYRVYHVLNSMQAVLDNTPNTVDGTSTPASGYVLGAHWKLRVSFAGSTIFELDAGKDGGKRRDLLLPDLSVHVSQFTGDAELRYELTLVETV